MFERPLGVGETEGVIIRHLINSHQCSALWFVAIPPGVDVPDALLTVRVRAQQGTRAEVRALEHAVVRVEGMAVPGLERLPVIQPPPAGHIDGAWTVVGRVR